MFAPAIFSCFFSFIEDVSDSAIGLNSTQLLEHLKGTRNVIFPKIQIESVRVMQNGYDFHMSKSWKEAAACYREVLQDSPGFSLAYKWLNEIIHGFHNYQESLQIAEESLRANFPKTIFRSHSVATQGGLAALALDRLEYAERFSKLALDHNDKDTTALRIKGEVLIRQNKLSEAQITLKNALEIEKEYGTATWLLGLTYFLLQVEPAAREYFEKAKTIDRRFDRYYDQEQTTKFLFAPQGSIP